MMSVEQKQDVVVIKIKGELILEHVEELKTKLFPLLQEEYKAIILDLSEVEFMDSSGIGFLVSLNNQAKQLNKHLLLLNPSKEVIKTLKLVNIYHFFEKIDEVDEYLTLVE